MGILRALKGAQAFLESYAPPERSPGGVWYPHGMPAMDTPSTPAARPKGGVNYTDYQSFSTSGIVANQSISIGFQLQNLPINEDSDLAIRLGLSIQPTIQGACYVGLSDSVVGYGSLPAARLTSVPSVTAPQSLPQGLRAYHESYPPIQLASGALAWTQYESSYMPIFLDKGRAAWAWFCIMVQGTTNPTVVTFTYILDVVGQVSAGYRLPGSGAPGAPGTNQLGLTSPNHPEYSDVETPQVPGQPGFRKGTGAPS